MEGAVSNECDNNSNMPLEVRPTLSAMEAIPEGAGVV
jgi:hypothetical protein